MEDCIDFFYGHSIVLGYHIRLPYPEYLIVYEGAWNYTYSYYKLSLNRVTKINAFARLLVFRQFICTSEQRQTSADCFFQ